MKLHAPLTNNDALANIKAGDWLSLSGTIYSARDVAHQRLLKAIQENRPLPFELEGAVIYYMGPSPTPPGRVIGSAGPTSSYRMDPYTPELLRRGVKAVIGKGPRGPAVRQALREHQALYLAAAGGVAALLAQCVKEAEIIAYPELGAEAVRRLHVEKMELICVNDIWGNDLYQNGQKTWRTL